MIGEELVFFSFLYIELFEHGAEVAFNQLQFFFVVSRWLLPKYARQVPSPLPFHFHRSTY